MFGVGSYYCLEEGVLPREGEELLVICKAPGYRSLRITGDAFVMENAVDSLRTTLL